MYIDKTFIYTYLPVVKVMSHKLGRQPIMLVGNLHILKNELNIYFYWFELKAMLHDIAIRRKRSSYGLSMKTATGLMLALVAM